MRNTITILSALLLTTCFAPVTACTTVNIPPAHSVPVAPVASKQPQQHPQLAASGDGELMGAIAVKDGGGALTAFKSRLDGSDHVVTHDVERCGVDASDLCKTEGAAHASGDRGVLNLAVRKDASGALTGVADGDRTPLQVDSVGALKTSVSGQDTVIGHLDGIEILLGGMLTVDGSAVTQPISASSLPLPTGAATSANQTTLIGHVDGVETTLGTLLTTTAFQARIPANGQAAMAASVPVALASNQTNPHYEVVALNNVATNSSQTSSEIDLRGYTEAWFECQMTGTTATGTIDLWHGLLSGDVSNGTAAARAYPLADVIGYQAAAADGDIDIDVSYVSESGDMIVRWHIIQPAAYNILRWNRTSGGGASGLTCRVFARAF